MVVDVGPGVTSVKKGDHVIPLYTPECRFLPVLPQPQDQSLHAIRATQGQGVMPDGTSRFSIGKDKIHHYMGCSTFANYTVLPENRGRQGARGRPSTRSATSAAA